jgi:hypothetical protein
VEFGLDDFAGIEDLAFAGYQLPGDLDVHWLPQWQPNQYCFMSSVSAVSADHSFSGVVRM